MSKSPSFTAVIGQAVGGKMPSPPIEDIMIADMARRALSVEPAFAHCWIRVRPQAGQQLGRDPLTVNGEILIRVVDGTVLLDGEVSCLGQKRLAGALAWWVPAWQAHRR